MLIFISLKKLLLKISVSCQESTSTGTSFWIKKGLNGIPEKRDSGPGTLHLIYFAWDLGSRIHGWDPGPGTLIWDPRPGILHLGPFTWDLGPCMWEPGPNTFTCNAGPVLRNPYINTTLFLLMCSLVAQLSCFKQIVHKFLQHYKRIDCAIKNMIVYLPFWLFFVHI